MRGRTGGALLRRMHGDCQGTSGSGRLAVFTLGVALLRKDQVRVNDAAQRASRYAYDCTLA